jgi:SAM-dependent methyltransferase
VVVGQHEVAVLPRTLDDVPGWFFWLDRLMFDALLTAQADTPTGHLVELGCFLGKSAIVIGAYRREGERFVVVDLFEHTDLLGESDSDNLRESRRSYSSLTQQAFERNYQTLRGELPEVVAGLSSSVVEHLPAGSVRFLHVDASHLYDAVRGDIAAAKQLLRPGGLVVFDDFRSEHTPGTSAAVWEAVASDGLVPVALTPQKMYAVFSDPEPYLRAVEALVAADDRIATERHLIAGHRLIRLGQSAKAKEQDRARRTAKEDAQRARTAAAQDRRMAEAVRRAVAADRRERQTAAARAKQRKAEREAAAAPTTLAGKIRRRVARDIAPPILVRWVRRQRKRGR